MASLAYEDNFESLFQKGEDLTAEKIILKFFDTEFLALKTEIPDKMMMDIIGLELLGQYLTHLGLKKSGKLCTELARFTKEHMISRNREGRHEGERMLGALREQLKNKGIISKLLGTE